MIAERIKQARENMAISKAELARRVNVSRASVSMWEDGKNVSFANILKIAEVLNVEPEWLQYGVTRDSIKIQDLADCIELTRKISTRLDWGLSNAQEAQIAAHLYQQCSKGLPVTESLVYDVMQQVEPQKQIA